MPPAGDEGTEGSGECEDPRAHLDEIDEACGCAELWEALSDRRGDRNSA
jgi:hypothetical protein